MSLISTTFEFKNLFSLNKKEIAKENRIKVEKLLVTELGGKESKDRQPFLGLVERVYLYFKQVLSPLQFSTKPIRRSQLLLSQ